MSDESKGEAPRGEPELASLRGRRAPAGLSRDLTRMAALPAAARERFWQVLAPLLPDPMPPTADQSIEEFAKAHGASRHDLAPALASARFLIRGAALVNATAEDLAGDVAALTDGDGNIAAVLVSGYETAKEIVRGKAKLASLSDHGKLVEGIDWRVDVMASSSHGARLNVPVAMLTIRYREGAKTDRITLQLTPEAVAELRKVCEQIAT